MRLTFPQLICLLEALQPKGSKKWIWNSLRRLNVLRNEYAHNLTMDRLETKRKEFIESTKPWIYTENFEEEERFKLILRILCGQLANIRHGVDTAG
jgi:hypothetical protein